MKQHKTSLTENQTYEKGELWETGLHLPKLSPTTRNLENRERQGQRGNSRWLQIQQPYDQKRRQEEATCSGTTGRGTLQRLQTLGLKCQEAPVETTRKNLGQSVAWSNLL